MFFRYNSLHCINFIATRNITVWWNLCFWKNSLYRTKCDRILRGGSKVLHQWFIDYTHVVPKSQKLFFTIKFSATSWNQILLIFCTWIEEQMINIHAKFGAFCDLWPETYKMSHWFHISSTAGKIKLHRTKCIKLMRNLIAVAIKILWKETWQVNICNTGRWKCRYVCGKTYGYCFKVLLWEIITNMFFILWLIALPNATAECLFYASKTKLNELNLSSSDSIGYGSDGASNMTGEHNSLWFRIRAESPHCMLVRADLKPMQLHWAPRLWGPRAQGRC